MMRCLISYKSDSPNHLEPVTSVCSSAIEHWQILAMKDWRFSPTFRKACQKDVKKNCDG
jgi:hypothetical protein